MSHTYDHHKTTDPHDDQLGRACLLCGGMLRPLGTLGNMHWERCERCGAEEGQSFIMPPSATKATKAQSAGVAGVAEVSLRCNRCHREMTGTTAYDGACACGGLIETTPSPPEEDVAW